MVGGRVFSGDLANSNASTFSILLPKRNTASTPADALFLSASASSFLGSGSMVSFADVQGGNGGSNGSTFRRFDEDEIGEDGMDEYVQHPEKKRRLTVEQVQFLEKSFDVENKLEPERKIQLAKDLGLQPRQVAIWFQNRRARWKTKQLEKDYESLEASYTNLKANYDHLLKEKDKLKAEVANLTEKVLLREETEKLQEPPLQKCVFDSASLGTCKQEDIASSGKSEDILVSESPHCTDGVHSSVLEHCDSSYAFDPDQSDLSQDEDDNLSKTLLPSHIFPKLEDVDYSDPPESSCHFGFAEEDDAFWSWSY